MRILVIVVLTPVLMLAFLYLASAPFDILLFTLEPEGTARHVLLWSRMLIALPLGIGGAIWVLRLIWRRMGAVGQEG